VSGFVRLAVHDDLLLKIVVIFIAVVLLGDLAGIDEELLLIIIL
jgi:hypothetical protein